MQMRLFILFLITTATFSVGLSCVNAEDEATKENENNKVEESTQPLHTTPAGAKKRSEVKTLEEFIPSEEVSADKPISFPADI